MADINRANSPMNIYREDTLKTKEEIDYAKAILHGQLNQKAPFLVGSIEHVNEKIANLDRELQMFSTLVIDSRGSNVEEDRTPSPAQEKASTKAQDIKQLNQFAGVYSVKSTLLSDNKLKFGRKEVGAKKPKENVSSARPKLVELHQYPGFESERLTPLPYAEVLKMLQRVTDAQTSLSRKPHYMIEFKRLFFSKMSEAIIVDLFWWFFLHRYHPSKMCQEKIFNRVAHNYTKLLLYAKHPKYRDVFFKAYPDILAQAVYCCFCEAFPDSWRQFNDDFQEDLCMLTSQWVAGTKVVPRTWMKWNYRSLEPHDMRKAEIIQQDSKKGRVLNFEFVTPETSSHKEPSVKSSHSSHSNPGVPEIDSDIKTIANVSNAQKGVKTKPQRAEGKGQNSLQPIAENFSDASSSLLSQKTITSSGTTKSHQRKSKCALTGKEKKKSDKGNETVPKQSSTVLFKGKDTQLSPESHPAYESTQFSKSAFNISGQSPLVKHFLRQKRLDKKAGMDIYLQRTEIKKLPPLNAPTYRELISDTYHNIRELDHNYQEMHEEGLREHAQFLTKQKECRKGQMRREKLLLSKPREVKRLSDLLVLELLKDEDEVSAGAALSVQAALMSQEDK
ncbi:protein FAM227A-like isoform X2 [Anneissia japonica]|uniref:protein FAM227A-like isoform X2 n=1 Tax=Anneissia japonica TaxID=1529436 RepID=UPI001425A8BD|nr:protein FAM227A-like isoform X2 [Anneissia japonica]